MHERAWPNLERAVIAWLTERTTEPVYSETEPAPTLAAARIVVERVGGVGYDGSKDVDVEVTVHAATRPAMWALAAQVETAMGALAAAGDPYVDDVEESFAFAVDPRKNPAAYRATATYTLTVRPLA